MAGGRDARIVRRIATGEDGERRDMAAGDAPCEPGISSQAATNRRRSAWRWNTSLAPRTGRGLTPDMALGVAQRFKSLSKGAVDDGEGLAHPHLDLGNLL